MGTKANKIILFTVIVLYTACGCIRNEQSLINNNRILSCGNSQLAAHDKKEIAKSFIMNVEYFRCNPESLEPANFYYPYSERYDSINMQFIPSPIITDNQISVSVERIEYSKDSCLCFAILLIENHYSMVEGLSIEREYGRIFDSQAVIGYRKSKNDVFKIYPDEHFIATGFTDKQTPVQIIERQYTSNLKKCGSLAGSIYQGKTFNENVGDSLFFENSPLFQKYDDTTFNFQIYRNLGKDNYYNYPY